MTKIISDSALLVKGYFSLLAFISFLRAQLPLPHFPPLKRAFELLAITLERVFVFLYGNFLKVLFRLKKSSEYPILICLKAGTGAAKKADMNLRFVQNPYIIATKMMFTQCLTANGYRLFFACGCTSPTPA